MSESAPARVFLAVVDETPEHRIAVRYAARRAAHTGGRLAMLYVIEPTELQHFMAIEELALKTYDSVVASFDSAAGGLDAMAATYEDTEDQIGTDFGSIDRRL